MRPTVMTATFSLPHRVTMTTLSQQVLLENAAVMGTGVSSHKTLSRNILMPTIDQHRTGQATTFQPSES